MIRIMILDDDEMYLKKEKDITEQYFAEKNVDCTVTIYQNVEWFLLGLICIFWISGCREKTE